MGEVFQWFFICALGLSVTYLMRRHDQLVRYVNERMGPPH